MTYLDQCTTEYNRAMANKLDAATKAHIAAEAALIIKTFGYEDYVK